MQSKETNQFAQEIDESIKLIIDVAKLDYKNRLSAIKDINNFSSEMVRMMRTTKAELTRGGVGEMKRVQKEQNEKLESVINQVDSKLSSLKGNISAGEDMLFLIGKLEAWIKEFDNLSIPAGPHSSACEYTASSSMRAILKKWIDHSKKDPIIKKVDLYKQKERLEKDIQGLKDVIAELESKLPDLQSNLRDRKDNPEKYRLQVEDEAKQLISSKQMSLEAICDELNNQEAKIGRLNTMLSSTGFFAFGKKKELKAQIQDAELNIVDIKGKQKTAELELKSAEDSLPKRIKELESFNSCLEERVKNDVDTLEKSKKELDSKQSELTKVEAQLK